MSRSAESNVLSGGILSLVRLVTGIVRVKIVALALGVSGVGVYAILAQLYLVGVALASMSLSTPIINLGRRPFVSEDYAEAGKVAGTALAIVGANCLLLILLGSFFGHHVLDQLGVGNSAQGLVWPILAAITLGAVSAAFGEGLSFLCDRFDAYVRVGIAMAIADMLFIGIGAWLDGLRGAVYAMPLGPLVMFVAYAAVLGRDHRVRLLMKSLSVKLSNLSRLISYSAIMLSAVALTNMGLTFLRSRVLLEAGADANGYLQTATSLAAYILAFVMTGFWGHLLAKAAALGDVPEVRVELDKSLRLGLLIAFTGCGVAAALAEYLIPLFYSHQFDPAVGLIIAYMPGEFCFQLFSMLVAYQLTVSLRRRYLIWNLGYIALLVGSGLIFVPRSGPWGYVISHILASLCMVSMSVTLGYRSGQISLKIVVHLATLLTVLSAVSVTLLYLRAQGFDGPYLLLALAPFAISGSILLVRLLREGWLPRFRSTG